ncbi:hypothetical protein Tco_0273147 [Tanacetum coccineum]
MTTLKFADTHNMVAFLAKPAESEGFEQIVDFLNAHTIKYALTINPTIYTSCIEQFWATVKAKTINGEVHLQALVDGKKIIITESIVRRDLQLEDAEGVDCLPNATIFEQLTLMRYEQNEFSSTMASAIICLATNQKFNFSKYIFESMVKNLENLSGKFLMYPRFIQVFLDKHIEGMPTHNRIYITPSHTKKIFGNMRRVGKGFSGRETPLSQTMMVQNQEEVGEGSEMPTNPHHTSTIIQPSTSQPQKKQRSRSLERAATTTTGLDVEQDRGNINKTRSKATLNEPSSSGTSLGSSPRGNTLRSSEDRLKLEELMELRTTLQSRVLALETTKTTQATEIASGSSRRVESSKDKGLGEEDASKQGRITDIDANEDIYLVNVQTDKDMFGVNDLDGDEVIVKSVDFVKTTEETRSVVEEVTGVTIPIKLKSVKPKATTITTTPTLTTTTAATAITTISTRPRAKGLVIHKQEQTPTPTVSSQQPSQVKVQDKGKGKMVELEPVKKMSKKELLRLDEELAFKLQAKEEEEEEEEERLAREKSQQI